jgi:type VI secretion system protein ImpM
MTPPLEEFASATGSPSGIAGWYGKLPCLGDFATRRLPSDFIECWDAWLQRSIATSRQQLGERWLDVFLTSPMWRFALAPGVCGAEACGGLLLPSVDKVGRYFPLTLALPLIDSQASVADLFAQQEWYSQLESIGLAALSVDFSPDQLELALAGSPFPTQRARAEPAARRDVLACMRDVPPVPHAFHLPSIDALSEAAAASAREIVASCTAGKSYWWSVAHESGATEFHCSAGLPADDYFCVLIGGERCPQAETVPLDPLQALDAAAAR